MPTQAPLAALIGALAEDEVDNCTELAVLGPLLVTVSV
jgi:hypothetical protein